MRPEGEDAVDGARSEEAPAPGPLAAKVDHLFRTVRPAKGEYSYEHVATSIKETGGPTISAAYLWMLRNGKRDNPTMRHLEALASFFGVPPGYFFDDALAARVDEQLALLASLRDVDVRRVALRASGLSSESLATIAEMIERVRKLEGLPERAGEEHKD
ncbi:XRE family transcriptional regulator [Kineococcus indalonis]|uniref:XRE family transcriptional regulator n=1 Tax=Kineococcus indalonis TaxID=2696566 RepID=UPI0038991391